MKVLLRADASPQQGTGHVMRSLTLVEGLLAAGHDVVLWTNESGVDWLEAAIESSGAIVARCEQHSLDLEELSGFVPDWLVVDSYEISADQISAAGARTRVLAIVDGTTRGILADRYVDQNLGAESLIWPMATFGRLLAGSRYALIRSAVLDERRTDPWRRSGRPNVVAVLGGSDPTGTIVTVARVLKPFLNDIMLDLVVNERWRGEVERELGHRDNVRIHATTPQLPKLLGAANIAISAAGTSAWELCALGIPSVFVGVVENQSESLRQLREQRLALGIDLTETAASDVAEELAGLVRQLLDSEVLCHSLSERCRAAVDGLGTARIIAEMESVER